MFKKNYKYFALIGSISVFLLIVMGGVVRSTGAAQTCWGWPLCQGSLLPPSDPSALAAYVHRLLALWVVPALGFSAFIARRYYHKNYALSLPMYAAALLVKAEVVLGVVTAFVFPQARLSLSSVHLGLSLLAQALALISTVVAFYGAGGFQTKINLAATWRRLSPFTKLSLVTLLAVFALMVSGAIEAASPVGWLDALHRILVVISGLLVGILFIQAWRTQRSQEVILVSATAAGILFLSQALLGVKVLGGPLYMVALHEATAAAVWAALVIETTAVVMARRTAEAERLETQSARGRQRLAGDFLALTKPIVVLLLLVTTFAGMVIGARALPPLPIILFTLLGGAMAAGGSGAINQYIDRFDDIKMQRTEKRPIPSGRMTPAEGLAFGTALSIGSFFLLVAYVNLLAALLSLAGIIYYVLIYSIFLKKATVQNIVIGGGAGAIPPLVGWAAATGSLNIPSLLLFAIIFMWTPPHFWSLAIVRRADYARAGVPMLPVVRGEGPARLQIFIYTLELVALSLFPPLIGLGSTIYIAAAVVLGGGLVFRAWMVWRKSGNKMAWKMYHYSNMYLAFLFLALMVDRLIIK